MICRNKTAMKVGSSSKFPLEDSPGSGRAFLWAARKWAWENIKVAFISSIALIAYNLLLWQSASYEYPCRPYRPTEWCDVGRYQISVRSLQPGSGHIQIARAKAVCVYHPMTEDGRILWDKLMAEDGEFESIEGISHFTEFRKIGLVAKQTEVCKFQYPI